MICGEPHLVVGVGALRFVQDRLLPSKYASGFLRADRYAVVNLLHLLV